MSSWSFEARQALSSSVSALPPPCLNDVVHIIFGSSREIVIGDEFTVDFESLEDRVCGVLDAYLNAGAGREAEDA